MKSFPIVLLLFAFGLNLYAQDVEGGKDPPLFERLPGFFLYDYKVTPFAGYQFCNEEGDNVIIEGMISYYYYETEGEIDPQKIVDKFARAVEAKGGKIYGDDPNQKYLVYQDENKQVWVDLFAEDFYYTLNIIEKGMILSNISSDDLLTNLEQEGQAVLYFNFDKDKCDIKEECEAVLEMLAGVFKSDPGLKIHVVAYTDNIGRTDTNLQLSTNRAKALVDKLLEKGVNEEMLTWEGKGEEDPISDNSTLEGRTLNNRIVLIKQ
jgi:outer membrane protein OmpA-like peptidoglycan-associated protein